MQFTRCGFDIFVFPIQGSKLQLINVYSYENPCYFTIQIKKELVKMIDLEDADYQEHNNRLKIHNNGILLTLEKKEFQDRVIQIRKIEDMLKIQKHNYEGSIGWLQIQIRLLIMFLIIYIFLSSVFSTKLK
jgi:hypothetical protein